MDRVSFVQRLHKMPSAGRLMISIVIGLIMLVLTTGSSVPVRFMSVWLACSLSITLLYWITFFTAKPHEIVKIARKQDASRPVIFLIILLSAFVSLLAVILMLKSLPDRGQAGYYIRLVLSVSSVVMGWVLTHTVFTVRYAHLYYQPGADKYKASMKVSLITDNSSSHENTKYGGLSFPGDLEPDYLDFAYFAFVIGMTFQVSDVEISSTRIRRIALIHGLLSFGFNAIIVALCINIISGIIEK